MEMILAYWHWFTLAAAVSLTLVVSIHAILHKRDSQAAVAWVAVLCFVPFLGAILYFMLGINRIKRRARRLRNKPRHPQPPAGPSGNLPEVHLPPLPAAAAHLEPLV